MNLEQAKELARQGIKMTHEYFTKDEYMTIKGNMIVFEDGAKIFINEFFTQDKEYFNEGWSKFEAIN